MIDDAIDAFRLADARPHDRPTSHDPSRWCPDGRRARASPHAHAHHIVRASSQIRRDIAHDTARSPRYFPNGDGTFYFLLRTRLHVLEVVRPPSRPSMIESASTDDGGPGSDESRTADANGPGVGPGPGPGVGAPSPLPPRGRRAGRRTRARRRESEETTRARARCGARTRATIDRSTIVVV